MKPLNYLRSLPILVIGLGMLFASCWGIATDPPEYQDAVREEAYVPIYGFDSAGRQIKTLSPQATISSGKIYVWGNLLFQVEQLKGIHVINYADKLNPVKIGFIQVRGCNELAVKGSTLITNNMKDLVTIDISSIDKVKEVGRIKDAFPVYYDDRLYQPSEKGKFYVCPDLSKGDVIGWTLEKNIKGAYCRTY